MRKRQSSQCETCKRSLTTKRCDVCKRYVCSGCDATLHGGVACEAKILQGRDLGDETKVTR